MKFSATSTVCALAAMMCLSETTLVDAKRRQSIRGSKHADHAERELVFSYLVNHDETEMEGRAGFPITEINRMGKNYGLEDGAPKNKANSKTNEKEKQKSKKKKNAKTAEKNGSEEAAAKGKPKDDNEISKTAANGSEKAAAKGKTIPQP